MHNFCAACTSPVKVGLLLSKIRSRSRIFGFSPRTKLNKNCKVLLAAEADLMICFDSRLVRGETQLRRRVFDTGRGRA